jgi:hypothetical protein
VVQVPRWFGKAWRWAENASTTFFLVQTLVIAPLVILGALFAVLADYWWLAPEALVGTWWLGELALGATYKRHNERQAVAEPQRAKPAEEKLKAAAVGRRAVPLEYQRDAILQTIDHLASRGFWYRFPDQWTEALAITDRQRKEALYEPLTYADIRTGLDSLENEGKVRIEHGAGGMSWEWDTPK